MREGLIDYVRVCAWALEVPEGCVGVHDGCKDLMLYVRMRGRVVGLRESF